MDKKELVVPKTDLLRTLFSVNQILGQSDQLRDSITSQSSHAIPLPEIEINPSNPIESILPKSTLSSDQVPSEVSSIQGSVEKNKNSRFMKKFYWILEFQKICSREIFSRFKHRQAIRIQMHQSFRCQNPRANWFRQIIRKQKIEELHKMNLMKVVRFVLIEFLAIIMGFWHANLAKVSSRTVFKS